jgi:hypothetical protein
METFKLTNGRTLTMKQDQWADNPRSWDNLSKVILFGGKKSLGDNHSIDSSRFANWEQNKKGVEREYNVAIIKPVYMYSHSGETISTSPFSCRFDSGQIGWVLVTKEDIRKAYTIKNVMQRYIDDAEKVLEGEIETLDQYVSGEVYQFEITDEDGNHEDSCSGFYGSDIKENGILDYVSEEDRELVLAHLTLAKI